MTDKQDQLERIFNTLDKVEEQTKNMIYNLALNMNNLEIIQTFNQKAIDLFTTMIEITELHKKEKEYKIKGYKAIFENALKINVKIPIDKFTLTILEFAADIYSENEEYFYQMTIPDAKLNLGSNEFGMLRSEGFKKLWIILTKEEQNKLKDNIVLLTTFAHVHLYKTLLSKKN